MISSIIGYLSKLQLSFAQIVVLAVATLVGGLVAALRVQGSALHKAQVQLLTQHIQLVDKDDDKAVQVARDRFNQAYIAYCKAKKE